MYVQKSCNVGKLTMQENNDTMYLFILFMAKNFESGQNDISVVLSRTIYLSPL